MQARSFEPVQLFAAILVNNTYALSDILQQCSTEFGPILKQSKPEIFKSPYYGKEMGDNLKKCFVLFDKKVPADTLWIYKQQSNKLETKTSHNGKRHINIDTGALTPYHLCLLSCKPYAHRIPLQHGIYAETTLLFEHNKVKTLPWTYPDYQTDEAINCFLKMRKLC
ncbi:MAG: DUF4416 family protein [bacterium]